MKQVTERKKCTKCNEGEMRATGSCYSNSVCSSYEHVCTLCLDRVQFTNESYPRTYYEFTKKEQKEIWK